MHYRHEQWHAMVSDAAAYYAHHHLHVQASCGHDSAPSTALAPNRSGPLPLCPLPREQIRSALALRVRSYTRSRLRTHARYLCTAHPHVRPIPYACALSLAKAVAVADLGETEVTEILQHRGIPKKRTDIERGVLVGWRDHLVPLGGGHEAGPFGRAPPVLLLPFVSPFLIRREQCFQFNMSAYDIMHVRGVWEPTL